MPRESNSLRSGTDRLNLLLCDENDARRHQLRSSILAQFPDARVSTVQSTAEARQLSQDSEVDVVLVGCPEGEGTHRCEEVRAWAGDIPIIVYEARDGHEALSTLVAVTLVKDQAHALPRLIRDVVDQQSDESSANGMHAGEAALPDGARIRAALLRLHHDINNPLSIIAGNAQLLLELARATGLDDDLVQPVRDIEEASQRASILLRHLTDIAARVTGLPPDQDK